jgi:hypothetical protein
MSRRRNKYYDRKLKLQAVQTYIHLLILRCKTLVGECPKPL